MARNLADLTGARTTKHSNGNGHGKAKGLRFNRFFTPPGSHAYDLVEWERRTASIRGEKGQVIFEQKDVEVPRSWSQLAINVVAQKYFRGSPGSPERETSVRQIIDRVVDTIAGSTKSGGTTRRAAKMVILNADHPDVVDFIHSKAEEEKKAWALIEAGYNAGFNVPGGAYDSVQFQNANHSVRVTDDFMRAYEKGGIWETRAVTDRGRVMDTFKARELMRKMAQSAWVCGDPGMQFDTTVNDWNPCANT